MSMPPSCCITVSATAAHPWGVVISAATNRFENVDVVRWRHNDADLELPRQVSLAVDRLFHRLLAADNALAIEPDLAIGGGTRQQMIGDGASQVECSRVHTRWAGIRVAHDIAVDVAAGSDRGEQRRIDRLDRRLQV